MILHAYVCVCIVVHSYTTLHLHHKVQPAARSCLTLPLSLSLSLPVPIIHHSRQDASCVRTESIKVFAGWLTLARPYRGVQKRTLLMRLSLLLQQCCACLVRPTRMVCEISGKWQDRYCSVECCFYLTLIKTISHQCLLAYAKIRKSCYWKAFT